SRVGEAGRLAGSGLDDEAHTVLRIFFCQGRGKRHALLAFHAFLRHDYRCCHCSLACCPPNPIILHAQCKVLPDESGAMRVRRTVLASRMGTTILPMKAGTGPMSMEFITKLCPGPPWGSFSDRNQPLSARRSRSRNFCSSRLAALA